MRLATVTGATGTTAAVLDGGDWRALPAPDLSALLAQSNYAGSGDMADPFHDLAERAGDVIPDAVPVLPLPRPGKILCCGLNYRAHIAETGRSWPEAPTLFAKFADTLTGPADELRLAASATWDWEAELAVVVGRPLHRADRNTALRAIGGWTVANDLSARDWQSRTLQWLQGKAWDASTPIGPIVVTPDEIDPMSGLAISCRLNGTQVQHDDTATLVFDPAHLLAYISTFTRLRPGDLVLTGTPGGVGMSSTPPHYLADGDVLETEIADIGTLRNTVRLVA
jgi:acylpyruvate hydrolase